jgi:hypothetical protein
MAQFYPLPQPISHPRAKRLSRLGFIHNYDRSLIEEQKGYHGSHPSIPQPISHPRAEGLSGFGFIHNHNHSLIQKQKGYQDSMCIRMLVAMTHKGS